MRADMAAIFVDLCEKSCIDEEIMAEINERMNVDERWRSKKGGSEFALYAGMDLQNKFKGAILAFQCTLTYIRTHILLQETKYMQLIAKMYEQLHVHVLSMEIN